MTLSLIIPCFNEAKNIPSLLKKVDVLLKHPEMRVVLVDNGSTDGTSELFKSYSHPHFLSVRVERNQGYGYGILAGLKEAQTPFLGWSHADLQTDPTDALRALEILKSHPDPSRFFIKGKREGRPLFDLFFTVGMAAFESCLLRTFLWDINAQPNFFSRSFFEKWSDPPHDFSLDLYAYYLAQRKGLQIQRFPVYFGPRLHGVSHWNTGWLAKGRFIKRTLSYSWTLFQNVKGNSSNATDSPSKK